MRKEILFAVLACVLVSAIGLAIAVEPDPTIPEQEVDSREFSVEKPCITDQVTARKGKVFGATGISCNKAYENCKIWTAKALYYDADDECKKYFKIGDNKKECHAYRGNFDSTTGIQKGSCNLREDGLYDASCWIIVDVKYLCN